MYTPSEIAKRYTEAGAAKTKNPPMKLFVLAVFAGIFIALGAFGSQVAGIDAVGASFKKFLSALIFPIGLLMVIMAGAELFTGNSLIIISVLDKKASIKGLIKNWIIVYIGNLAGSIFIAMLLTYSDMYSMFGGELAESVVATAQTKVGLSFQEAFLRGILCNILVCIAVWVSFSAEDVAGKIIGLFLPITLFVISGYEHCVANMYFIPAGLLAAGRYDIDANSLTWGSFFVNNLIPVTIGNIIGGAFIVGAGYFFVYLHNSKA